MDNFKKISQYFRRELDDEELLEFKNTLKSDSQLQKDLHSYIEYKKLQKRKIIKEENITSANLENIPIKTYNRLSLYTIIVSFLLLLAAGSGVFMMRSNEQDLFEQYYTSESGSFVTRSGNSTINASLMQGLQLYESGDYNAAIKLFDKSPEQMISKLYRGLSYIELSDYYSAMFDFQEIIDHNDILFVDQARWYLSLCYIKIDQFDKAKEQLNIISKSKSSYKTKADKIINELK